MGLLDHGFESGVHIVATDDWSIDDLIHHLHDFESANDMSTEDFMNAFAEGKFEGLHGAHEWLGAALALAELKGSAFPPPADDRRLALH